ncbi:MAG TPA: cobalamin-binding protein [bacterium]|nr:cobalamin-binding protein [bacterium]
MRCRIVSTSPDVTEILCALNLFEDLAGVSRFCDWPPEVKILPVVSDFLKLDAQALEEARPDVVICSTAVQKEIVRDLTERHVRTVVLHPHSLQSIFDNIRLLGDLFGRTFEAGDLVSRMKREFFLIREEASRFEKNPRVFCEEWGDPLIVGIGWIQEMSEAAGGRPTHPELFPEVGSERRTIPAAALRERNPEIILLSWCGMGGRVNSRILEAREGWKEIEAVKSGRVYPVNDTLFVRPGPRLIEGTRQILNYVRDFQNGRD